MKPSSPCFSFGTATRSGAEHIYVSPEHNVRMTNRTTIACNAYATQSSLGGQVRRAVRGCSWTRLLMALPLQVAVEVPHVTNSQVWDW